MSDPTTDRSRMLPTKGDSSVSECCAKSRASAADSATTRHRQHDQEPLATEVVEQSASFLSAKLPGRHDVLVRFQPIHHHDARLQPASPRP